jgi:hypothetical protein
MKDPNAEPLTREEYAEMDPVLAVHRRSDGDIIVGVDIEAFDAPALWGMVLADIVKNIATAYEQEGISGRAVYDAVRDSLYAELEVPTAKAQPLRLVDA